MEGALLLPSSVLPGLSADRSLAAIQRISFTSMGKSGARPDVFRAGMETDDVSRYCTESCEPDFGEREAVDWVCELGVRTGRFDWAGLCNLGDILEDTEAGRKKRGGSISRQSTGNILL